MKTQKVSLKPSDSPAAITVGVVGLALGVVGLINQGANSLQWLLVGVSVLFLAAFLYTNSRYSTLESNLLSLVQGDGMNIVEGPLPAMDEMYRQHSSATAFVDLAWYERFSDYCSKPEVALKTKWLFMGGRIPKPQPTRSESHLLRSPLTGLFFFDSQSNSPRAAVLYPHSTNGAEPICIRISDPGTVAAIFSSFVSVFGDKGIRIEDAVDSAWLQQHVARVQQRISNDWEDLKALRITARSPAEIYTEQLNLSKQSDSIHAFDMTDVDEWFDPANLGGCLASNIKKAKSGADGDKRIRRIFLAPARESLVSKPDYAKKLRSVIEMHKSGGLGYGLIFQHELRMRRPGYIKDFVVYDKRVVWVETQPTTRYGGEGYFSTSRAEVGEYIGIFENVWAEDTPKSPIEDAEALLNLP